MFKNKQNCSTLPTRAAKLRGNGVTRYKKGIQAFEMPSLKNVAEVRVLDLNEQDAVVVNKLIIFN